MVPKNGLRFPACEKPWDRPPSRLDASAGEGRSERIMLAPRPLIRALACIALLLAASSASLAQMADCSSEAARIKRAEDELPRLDVAPPGDRTIVCITLETNLLFARRLAAHLAQCPRSPLARGGNAWAKTGRDYQALYSNRGCKQTIKGYRG
jgi:hypothetical protein